MSYFVYHINTLALYCQEKSTLVMNENKRIENHQTKTGKCVGALKMKISKIPPVDFRSQLGTKSIIKLKYDDDDFTAFVASLRPW